MRVVECLRQIVPNLPILPKISQQTKWQHTISKSNWVIILTQTLSVHDIISVLNFPWKKVSVKLKVVSKLRGVVLDLVERFIHMAWCQKGVSKSGKKIKLRGVFAHQWGFLCPGIRHSVSMHYTSTQVPIAALDDSCWRYATGTWRWPSACTWTRRRGWGRTGPWPVVQGPRADWAPWRDWNLGRQPLQQRRGKTCESMAALSHLRPLGYMSKKLVRMICKLELV